MSRIADRAGLTARHQLRRNDGQSGDRGGEPPISVTSASIGAVHESTTHPRSVKDPSVICLRSVRDASPIRPQYIRDPSAIRLRSVRDISAIRRQSVRSPSAIRQPSAAGSNLPLAGPRGTSRPRRTRSPPLSAYMTSICVRHGPCLCTARVVSVYGTGRVCVRHGPCLCMHAPQLEHGSQPAAAAGGHVCRCVCGC